MRFKIFKTTSENEMDAIGKRPKQNGYIRSVDAGKEPITSTSEIIPQSCVNNDI